MVVPYDRRPACHGREATARGNPVYFAFDEVGNRAGEMDAMGQTTDDACSRSAAYTRTSRSKRVTVGLLRKPSNGGTDSHFARTTVEMVSVPKRQGFPNSPTGTHRP